MAEIITSLLGRRHGVIKAQSICPYGQPQRADGLIRRQAFGLVNVMVPIRFYRESALLVSSSSTS